MVKAREFQKNIYICLLLPLRKRTSNDSPEAMSTRSAQILVSKTTLPGLLTAQQSARLEQETHRMSLEHLLGPRSKRVA